MLGHSNKRDFKLGESPHKRQLDGLYPLLALIPAHFVHLPEVQQKEGRGVFGLS